LIIDEQYEGKKMERRVTQSHPDYEKLNKLAGDLAIATNPQAHFWHRDEYGVPELIDEIERKALIEIIKERMDEELEGGRFADWINQSELFR
jgi:hypothetical protein